MSYQIKGYTVKKDFSSAGAGTSTWCIAEKEGKRYFIKQFLTPVLVSEESKDRLSPAMVDSMQKACLRFVTKRNYLYTQLKEIQTGSYVIPDNLGVYNGHYIAISEAVKSTYPAEEIYRLETSQKLMLMRTMVYNLKLLAGKHIVHSDIKLDNLMITDNACGGYWLKLIDFDSGFMENDPPRNVNDFHGDMVYFAPEAMCFMNSEGESDVILDNRIDKFALGLVLHQMWCGQLPGYDTEQFANCAEALLCESRLELSPTLSTSPRVSKVISGLLKLDPDERLDYDTAYKLLGEELAPLAKKLPKPVEEDSEDEEYEDEPYEDDLRPANTSLQKTVTGLILVAYILIGLVPFVSSGSMGTVEISVYLALTISSLIGLSVDLFS